MAEYSNIIKRKLTQYFKQKWGMMDYRNGWLKGECPFCGKVKFGVSIHDSRANCFSCGNYHSPIKVIMELENFATKPEVYNYLKAFEGIDFLQPKIELREWKKVELPESFKLLALGNSMLGDKARDYMRNRGFNINSLSAKGIGYCTRGPYAGFIVFPFYQNGEIVYFIGRQFIQLWEKFKNPSVEDFGIGKSMITYNADSLLIFNKIYCVESITNCLTMGDNSIGTLGKKISDYQLSLIYRSPAKEIIIGYDDDAITESIRLGLKMVYHKKVKILNFPEKQDINDLGKKAVKKIEKAAKWLTYQDLIKLKNHYEKGTLNSY